MNDAFTFLVNKFLRRLRKQSFAQNNQYCFVNVPKSIYSMSHLITRWYTCIYAAPDMLFIYLKVRIINIYTNKYMQYMLLKINLIGIAQLNSSRVIVRWRTWLSIDRIVAEFHQRALFTYAYRHIYQGNATFDCILSSFISADRPLGKVRYFCLRQRNLRGSSSWLYKCRAA